MIGGHMKIFSIAAVLTGLVLVSISVRKKKLSASPNAAPGLSDVDLRYAIDDLVTTAE